MNSGSRSLMRCAESLVRALAPVQERRDGGVRSIAVYGPGGMGDVIMKMPLLAGLRRAYPEAGITFVTSPGSAAEIAAGAGYVDEVITLSQAGFGWSRLPEAMRLLRCLRRRRFDLMITTWFGRSFKAASFAYLCGAPVRVGFDWEGRGGLHTVRVPLTGDGRDKHTVEHNLDLLRALGKSAETTHPRVTLTDGDEEWASRFLSGSGLGDACLIGVAPGSRRESRLWSESRFAETADALADEFSARIVLIGGSGDASLLRAIASGMRTRPVIAGSQSVKCTAALIRRFSLLVSVDSGPMHLGAAVGTPVLGLFGPGDEKLVAPYSPDSRVVRKPALCGPCYNDRCPRSRCMDLIEVSDVLTASREILASRPAGGWGGGVR